MKFLTMLLLVITKSSFVYGDVSPEVKQNHYGPMTDTSGHEKQTYQEQLEGIENHGRNENNRDNKKIEKSLEKGDNTGKSKK